MGLGGDVEFARALEVACDAEVGDGRLDGVEVFGAEALEGGDLVREPFDPVGQPVGEAGGTESAVAARGCPAAPVALEEDDITRRIVLLSQKCCPQAGVAAADDDQVGLEGSDQWKCRLRGGGVVQPERQRSGVSESGGTIHGANLPATRRQAPPMGADRRSSRCRSSLLGEGATWTGVRLWATT